MRFWDSSAIVPLLIAQRSSPRSQYFFHEDREMIVWSLTSVECVSAFHRLEREGHMELAELRQAKIRLKALTEAWHEITDIQTVRVRAQRLLGIYALRAADALQLAAALVAFEDQPEGGELLTYDSVLAQAAEREGFTLLLEF